MPGLDGTTAITLGGIQCWDEGVREDFSRDRLGGSATRFIRCAWNNRKNLIKFLQGSSQQIGLITLIVPGQPYPDYTGFFVDTIGVTGEGTPSVGPNGMLAWTWALLEVKYTPLDLSVSTSQIDFGKEVISFPKESLKFDDGTALDQGMAISVPCVCFRKPQRNLPRLPLAAILAASDKPLNISPIFGGAAGKVLFDGGISVARYAIDVGWQFDMEYTFLYKPMGWGKALDATGAWRTVRRKDGTDLIERSDLKILFSADNPPPITVTDGG